MGGGALSSIHSNSHKLLKEGKEAHYHAAEKVCETSAFWHSTITYKSIDAKYLYVLIRPLLQFSDQNAPKNYRI